ncbi:hypothetical protein M959_05883, partial [Chaetura pelagica]
GSIGIDLAAAVDVTLITTSPVKIPTGIHGPIIREGSMVGALLLGRSSTGLAGLVVLPGVIDADYTGEIQIVAFTLHPPMTITKGTRIAQLILYEKHPLTPSTRQPSRGNKGFGSTGQQLVNLVQQMQQRPQLTVVLKYKQEQHTVRAMTDTGADVTIFS